MCLDGQLPFSSWPEQVGPQDDGDVRGCHLIHSLLLRQQGQELDQIPDRQTDRQTPQQQASLQENYDNETAEEYLQTLLRHWCDEILLS